MIAQAILAAALSDGPSLATVEREHAAAQAEPDPHLKAEDLFRLNAAVDEYVDALNHQPAERPAADWLSPDKMPPVTEREVDPAAFRTHTSARIAAATRFGVRLQWCEPDGDWTAGTDAYLAYLTLWPNGPDAEEAWWRAKLIGHTRTACYDGEGTREEMAWFVDSYSEFLTHFPGGAHHREAEQILKDYRAKLAAAQRQEP